VESRAERRPGPGWDVWELTHADARAEVHPARGGLVARFEVDGQPVLYLDEATLRDPGKNVRGGIPVLFPFAGRPPPGSPLPQHGVARTLAWDVLEASAGADGASLRMGLQVAPYGLQLHVRVAGRRLSVEARVENRGTQPLPVHYGLHPYFFVPDAVKGQARLEVEASRAYDHRTGQEGPFAGFDFTADEWDVHLLDARTGRPVLHRPGLPPVTFEWSLADFPVMVTWAVKGKDYLCVEPWTARGGQPSARVLQPGEACVLPFAFSA
jgi:galactose mutarotase-like enzyme